MIHIHSLFKDYKNRGMTAEEKKRTWDVISERTFLREPTPSVRNRMLSRLYYGGLLPTVSRVCSPYSHKRMYMVSISLGVLILSGSLSALAEGALPGSPLYAIKIGVNEKLQIALLSTPQEKAVAEAILATRRLEEVERLAVVGKLNPVTAEQAATLFSDHVEKLQTHISELETRLAFSDIAQVGVLFQTRIAVHAAVLKDIEVNSVMLSSSNMTPDERKHVIDSQLVTQLESKVLPVVIPIVVVTKKAIVNIVPAPDREALIQNDVRNGNTIALFIDKAEAKEYLTELHNNVGIPTSTLENSIPPVIPTFVP